MLMLAIMLFLFLFVIQRRALGCILCASAKSTKLAEFNKSALVRIRCSRSCLCVLCPLLSVMEDEELDERRSSQWQRQRTNARDVAFAFGAALLLLL